MTSFFSPSEVGDTVVFLLQKHFIDEVKKTIGNHHSVNKQLAEGAAVLCVRLCKASTYISIHDRLNVLFSLVQSVINDLKVGFTSKEDNPQSIPIWASEKVHPV